MPADALADEAEKLERGCAIKLGSAIRPGGRHRRGTQSRTHPPGVALMVDYNQAPVSMTRWHGAARSIARTSPGWRSRSGTMTSRRS
jgi:hypothetical protein